MKPGIRNRIRLASVVSGLLLASLGVVIALGLTELSLRFNPSWVPANVRTNPPVRRVQAFRNETYDVRLSDGDLFYWMKGAIEPLSPEKDMVVARVHLVTNADGFRNPELENVAYDIIALGDSFTFAANAAAPWPEKLAEYTSAPVLNLGESGAGPQIQLEILRRYGLQQRPRWIVMAYFGGNDLYDAGAYDVSNPFLLTRIIKHLLSPDSQDVGLPTVASNDGSNHYPYPISVNINDSRLEMAFFSYYVAWLSASSPLIESSHNYRLVKDTILETRQLSETVGARLLLVYVPSKPHLYLPYVNDSETSARVFARVPKMELDDAGYLQFINEKATPQVVNEHMGDQVSLLATFTAANGIDFLDLTPRFQQQVARGEELYYPFDTHWNQRGHDLAAQAIHDYISSTLVKSSKDQPGATIP